MCQDGSDVENLFLEIDVGEQAVLVASDIEDVRLFSRVVIGCGECRFHFGHMEPRGGAGDFEKAASGLPERSCFRLNSVANISPITVIAACSHFWDILSMEL
jgi:hypothetical protein